MSVSPSNVDDILATVPHLQRGPGGVVGIVKDGKVLGKRAWGYADLDRRIPMTTDAVFPICSISKQMVCLVMFSLLKNPTAKMGERKETPAEQMEQELKSLLPGLAKNEQASDLKLADLCNMQSGIRDYWAMTTLWGAKPDDPFSLLQDAPYSLSLIHSFHFQPGTEYSYSNVNFHVLGRVLENLSGFSLNQLLSDRLFMPAGMTTAALCPNTNGLPLPVRGYEGNEDVGYFVSTNRIEWAGDAGIAASLEDMINYEIYLDKSWSEPESLYTLASKQQYFRDDSPAAYGYGFARGKIPHTETITLGHGGALRGFRHARIHIPDERLSVVVLMNYEVNPEAPVSFVVKSLLNLPDAPQPQHTLREENKGDYYDPGTGLYMTVKSADKPGHLSFRYGPKPEMAPLTSPTTAQTPSGTIYELAPGTLTVHRPNDGRVVRATRIPTPSPEAVAAVSSADFTGIYHSAESKSTFHCTGENGTLYGSFDGFVGKGPIWLMRYVGQLAENGGQIDIFALGNPRGLDATPPGDWTVVFKREGSKVVGCTIGCFLARKVDYTRV